MDEHKPTALSAIVIDEEWEKALEQALEQVKDITADLVFLFANIEFAPYYEDMLRVVRREMQSPIVIGCSAQGIVGTDQELEDLPAVSLLALSLPGAHLYPVRITQEMVESTTRPQQWHAQLGLSPEDVNAWFVFADPFQLDCEGLIASFSKAYAGIPMLGGLASGDLEDRYTYVFLNNEVFEDGAVGVAFGGPYTIYPLVSQGCDPIGETWTVTSVLDNGLLDGISNRSAHRMLVETLKTLNPDIQRGAQRNLMIGLAANEYQDSYERGSFLVRQLFGVDRRTGALAIGASTRVGQTLQFHLRNAASADLDLHEQLARAKRELGDSQPIAGILCTCNGRGIGMFGVPDHDASVIARELGQMPLAGLFCNGEVGPVGDRAFLHSFTASLGLLVKKLE
jgi:small ligand-binding sensory domain FIST